MPDPSDMNEVARLIVERAADIKKDPELAARLYQQVTKLAIPVKDVYANLLSVTRHTAAGFIKHVEPALGVLRSHVPECANMALPGAGLGAGGSAVKSAARMGARVAGGKALLILGALLLAAVATYYGAQYLGSKAGDDPVQPGPAVRGRDPVRGPTSERDRPAAAKDDAWVAWYVDNIAWKPVMIGTMRDYLASRLCNTYPGGGRPDAPSEPMVKILIVDGARSRKEAADQARAQFANVRPAGRLATYSEWVGDRSGQVHDIDEVK